LGHAILLVNVDGCMVLHLLEGEVPIVVEEAGEILIRFMHLEVSSEYAFNQI